YARIKKLDFNLAIGNRSALPDQLMQPLIGDRADPLFVNIESMRRTWRLAVDQHPKSVRPVEAQARAPVVEDKGDALANAQSLKQRFEIATMLDEPIRAGPAVG